MSTPPATLAWRWLVFNAVGVGGAALQLAVLTALVHGAGLHYAVATAVAVEAAVLHNFLWHQRWTWRDRPAAAPGRRLARAALARFHASNGLVSLVGNLLVMSLLVGSLGLAPVVANGVAIVACSALTFALGDRWVFPEAGPL